MSPTVSVLIPTCNRTEYLARCLRALIPQIPADRPVEILVCDDSRGPETREFLEKAYPGIGRHSGPRRGPGANRNVGARAARTDWLIFLDDDVIPQPGMLAAYLDAIQSKTKGLLAGRVFTDDPRAEHILWEAPGNSADVIIPPSCNFAISRKDFLESGGFDERYEISFEDMEFFSRLILKGMPYHYLEGAAVEHPPRPLPSARKLALRWKARVLSSYDFGATTPQVLFKVPRHVLLIILSRFQGRRLDGASLRAAALFLREFFWMLLLLPGWMVEGLRAPRSAFWMAQEQLGKTPRNFGL